MDAREKVSVAKSRLATEVKKPFYYGIVYLRPITFGDPRVKTAAMSGRGEMFFNEDWVDTLTIDEVVFVMAHEAMHFMLRHAIRRGTRDPVRWNIAGDYVINDMLIYDGVGKAPANGAYKDGARAHTADELYTAPEESQGDDGQGGSGGGGDPGELGDIGHDILEEPMTPEEVSQAEAECKLQVISAEKMMKARGMEIHEGLKKMIERIKVKPVPWHDILEQHMSLMVNADQSWSRPNKKYRHMGLYMPVTEQQPVLGTVVIVFDTSGSISLKEGRMFASHCNTIFEKLPPQKVYLMHVDSRLQKTFEFDHDELPIEVDHMYGGGGTSMKPATDYIRDELNDDIECMIYFSDMWSDQDEIEAPPYPVFFGATERGRGCDWGTIIDISEE